VTGGQSFIWLPGWRPWASQRHFLVRRPLRTAAPEFNWKYAAEMADKGVALANVGYFGHM
jgi:hypothetical protein